MVTENQLAMFIEKELGIASTLKKAYKEGSHANNLLCYLLIDSLLLLTVAGSSISLRDTVHTVMLDRIQLSIYRDTDTIRAYSCTRIYI